MYLDVKMEKDEETIEDHDKDGSKIYDEDEARMILGI